MENNYEKKLSFPMALFSLLAIVAIMFVGVKIFKIPTVALFAIVIITLSTIALLNGYKMQDVEDAMINGCKKSSLVVMILIAVGMVVGTWIISGVVPSIIYYGLKILSPAYFLVLGFLIISLVAFFTGSTYTAVATLGVAFMGIGLGMGINPALTAGMVISGSIVGDKMSPFSETSNMAAAIAGTDIITHLRSCLFTVLPASLISAVLYAILGLKYSGSTISMDNINIITSALEKTFVLSPILLLVPVLTIVLAVKKVPPTLAVLLGAVFGLIAAFIFQPSFGVKAIISSLSSGFSFDFGDAMVNKLLNKGGVSSMMSTVALAILALTFGELLQMMGVLETVLSKIKNMINSSTSLVIATLITALLTVMATASQYMGIILPGQFYKNSYDRLKIKPYVLSRTLEDGGTIFSYLVPWSAASIYVSGVLDVPTIQSIPYSFLAILCPVLAVVYAITGFAIFKEGGSQLKELKAK